MPLSLCLSLSTLVGLIITVVDTRRVFSMGRRAAVCPAGPGRLAG
mgnify:CR=1 FL=1